MTLITRMALPTLLALAVVFLGGCENHSSQELVIPSDPGVQGNPISGVKNLRGDLTNPEGSEYALDTGERHEGSLEDRFTLLDWELKNRQTNRNAVILERALWNYLEDNDWEVPRNFQYENSAGKALVDYLPEGKSLINPFTLDRTEPQYDTMACTPGQVGFLLSFDAWGECAGVMITAFGKYHTTLEYFRYLPDYEPPYEPQGSEAPRP